MSIVSEIIGLGIGEETKGAWVEFLAKQTKAKYIWRKGGPQSGHHLVIDDSHEAMLSHFGAGVFQGIPTYVDMPIIPVELFIEAMQLEEEGIVDPLSLIIINASCLVVTPYHQAISRLQETLREKKKGTIGLGVGEAISDASDYPEFAIYAHELKKSQGSLESKIESIRLHLLSIAHTLIKNVSTLSEESQIEVDHLKNSDLVSEIAESYNLLSDLVHISYETFLDEILVGNTVIETSHGAQLHPRYGYIPHVTKIDPVGQDALKKLESHLFSGNLRRFGVCRAYSTRYGAGPFVVYDEKLSEQMREVHNTDNDWLGKFKKGPLDLVGIAYGIKICEEPDLDGIMVSFLDSLRDQTSWPVCIAYQYSGPETNLAPYFVICNGLITEIKFHQDDGSENHIDHQRRLTKLLWDCTPIILTLTSRDGLNLEETFITFVEQYLGLPIVAVAHGPRLSDRTIRPGYENCFV
jgi:adenylosuccinate synthase